MQLSRTETEAIRKLRQVINIVRLVDDAMPIQTLSVLLDIARHPKTSVNEISTRTGLAQSSASRNVAALSDRHWLKRPGLGMVELVLNPEDIRRKDINLTAKGERFIQQIVSQMDASAEENHGTTEIPAKGDTI